VHDVVLAPSNRCDVALERLLKLASSLVRGGSGPW
jgi:hypothetical protein